MRNVWLYVVLVSISLLAGMGHAQTCSFQFRTPMGVPVADRPALPVPVAMNTAQPMPGPTCQATTWVSATMPAGVTYMNDLACGNGLCVAVADAFAGQAKVLRSTDGITWTSSSTPVANNNGFRDIAFGNGVFVATHGCCTGSRVMYSTDGDGWTSAGVNSFIWNNVQYANGIFMIVAMTGGSQSLQTSTDGISFTVRAQPPVSDPVALAFGNGRWVVVGQLGANRAAFSTDNGASWTAATTNLSSYVFRGVAFGAGKFLAVGDSGAALTSVDGANWTVVSTTQARDWRAAAYGHGRFVIGSGNFTAGARLMTSNDGIAWTDVTASSGLPNNSINSIIAGPDRFYLIDNPSQAGIWYSTN